MRVDIEYFREIAMWFFSAVGMNSEKVRAKATAIEEESEELWVWFIFYFSCRASEFVTGVTGAEMYKEIGMKMYLNLDEFPQFDYYINVHFYC